jgi:hypothetical protein
MCVVVVCFGFGFWFAGVKRDMEVGGVNIVGRRRLETRCLGVAQAKVRGGGACLGMDWSIFESVFL